MKRDAVGLGMAWAAQLILACALAFVPLFNVLSYEFCATMGLLTAITAPCVGLVAARRADRPGAAVAAALWASIGHILPPLVIMLCNALRVRNCNFSQGMVFWALLPLATAVYGGTLGTAVGRLGLHMGTYTRTAVLAGVITLPLLHSLYGLYTQPPIFFFDHLWGYFAGSLYDETIRVDARLVVFRLGTLLRTVGLAATVIAWERWPRLGTAKVGSTVLVAMAACVTFELTAGPRFGFRLGRAQLTAHLPVQVQRHGLVIHLPAGTAAATQAQIADDHAFRLARLSERLEIGHMPDIHSYVYKDAADKAFWMGGKHTSIAKPWLHEIHVHGLQTPHGTMPHELAHAVAAGFGSNWLGLSARYELWVNMGLVEGLAEALSPDGDTLDLHHWARALFDMKLAPDMRTVLSPEGFWAQAPRRAYTVAGSFVRYLLERDGPIPLKLAYARGDFDMAYGQPLAALVTAWEKSLSNLTLTPTERHIAQERFRTPSIFARPCAHEVAELTEAAERAEPPRAVSLRQQIAVFVDHTPEAEVNLAQARLAAGDLEGFLSQADALLALPELDAQQRAALQQAACMALWQVGRTEEARQRAQAIMELQVDDPMQRLAWVRLWAMDQPAETQQRLMPLTEGVLGAVPAAVLLAQAHAAQPTEKTYAYLLGRQLMAYQAWEQAVEPLAAAAAHPFAPIELERQRLQALNFVRLGRLDAAAQAWQRFATLGQSSGHKAQAQDGLAQVRWQLNYPPLNR